MKISSNTYQPKIVLKPVKKTQKVNKDLKKTLNPKLPSNTPFGTVRFKTPFGGK